MKKILFLTLIGASILLSACQPVSPAAPQDDPTPETTDTEEPEIVEGPGEVEHDPLAYPIEEDLDSPPTSFNPDQITESDSGPIPVPAFEWDTDPETLILSGTACCGFTTRQVVMNYVPSFQLWGDGHMIWVYYEDSGERVMLEAMLSPEQIRSILQRAADDGFYDWKNRYSNELVADVADQCITINLTEANKMVCEYFEGAPPEFRILYTFIEHGAGLSGTPYVPETAFLVAEPMGGDITPSKEPYTWTTTNQDELLKNALDGIWVSGELLAGAWEALNASPWNTIFEENGILYAISIQVPGVNMMQPEG